MSMPNSKLAGEVLVDLLALVLRANCTDGRRRSQSVMSPFNSLSKTEYELPTLFSAVPLARPGVVGGDGTVFNTLKFEHFLDH